MPSASGARTWDDEAEYWSLQLRNDELEFANLVLSKAANGYTLAQCYGLTHPKVETRLHTAYAERMKSTHAVSGYLQAMRQETISDTIMSLDELREDLTIQIRGYDHLFDGLVTWEDTPIGRIAFVDRLSDVPVKLRRYVNGHQYHAESEGYELYLRQYPGKEADKNKARQLLAQMQGGLVDRKEVNVTGALIQERIENGMSDTDAEKIYKRAMRSE